MSKKTGWQNQVKSFFQLGLEHSSLYGLYQFGLKSGQITRQTPIHAIQPEDGIPLTFPWQIPDRQALSKVIGENEKELRIEAEEILRGQFRCFGGPLKPILLRPAAIPPEHWTIATIESLQQDIKWFWEPARFGWVFLLARAYTCFDNEKYAQFFWEKLEEFIAFNPANGGPNWASAQEVAIRLMAVAFAAGVFRESPHSTPLRMELLRGFVRAHADRIPATLNYSRAQNNNHLLTEAAGLWTASILLHGDPAARRWIALGQANFNRGILKQVALDGSYAQYSNNYHRVLLRCALWIYGLYQGRQTAQQIFTVPTLTRLRAAVRYLLVQTDLNNGAVPNYGHNDGANILPLSVADYGDYRPTLQAAGRIFLDMDPYPAGPWDETCLWLGYQPPSRDLAIPKIHDSPAVLKLANPDSWAVLRATTFHSRPAHADQLHVDLWYQGKALALDAGTYAYNEPAPWENALASVAVHNTVQVDDIEPMTRAGRFLWLDWDQAELLKRDAAGGEIAARRNGYRRIGVGHERRLSNPSGKEWQILDKMTASNHKFRLHIIRLHWLITDLPWSLDGNALELRYPAAGLIRLTINCPTTGILTLDRAGERLYGSGASPAISGWVSPTYGVRLPALSLSVTWQSALPLEITSRWQLPG
ncbi:MAG TPA: alginate lyase family protein [Longilinea sp.]|nr:alginate lyase family protein [Longilinea sp.]